MLKWVLMISPNDFPEGDAGAIRDESFARVYAELGYKPVLVCNGKLHNNGTYHEIPYFSLYKNAENKVEKLRRFFDYSQRLEALIKELEEINGPPKIVHLYDAPPKAIHLLKQYARKNKCLLVHDSVEWYSSCQFRMGRFDKSYILKNRLNRHEIDNSFRVIAISSFLFNYYKSKGINTVRIPVIMDTNNVTISSTYGDKVRFIYAGNPASKDYLKEVVTAFGQLIIEDQKKVVFNVYGISNEQLMDMTGLRSLPICINAHGRVPREEVISSLINSDLSVLLRPENERYAKAGFPTKCVEAMTHGVAMFCNLTSDLNEYLRDNDNSIICKSCEVTEIKKGILRVLNMNRNKINSIKNNARITSENNFDYRLWTQAVKTLIDG